MKSSRDNEFIKPVSVRQKLLITIATATLPRDIWKVLYQYFTCYLSGPFPLSLDPILKSGSVFSP